LIFFLVFKPALMQFSPNCAIVVPMLKFLAILTGLLISLPSYSAGLGYDPFERNSPTSPTGASKPSPASPGRAASPAPRPGQSAPAPAPKQDLQPQKSLNTQNKK
jgi:hypothetical protein